MMINQAESNNLNIIITGVGGQGNITLSRLLGEIIINDENFVTIGETFGASQRGGSVMSHLRVSKAKLNSPLIPKKSADLIIGLEPIETIRVLTEYGNQNVMTISNTWTVMPAGVLSGENEYPDHETIKDLIENLSLRSCIYNFTKLGEEMGHHLLSNAIITGIISGLNLIKEIDLNSFSSAIKSYYCEKLIDLNLKAFEKGRDLSKSLNMENG